MGQSQSWSYFHHSAEDAPADVAFDLLGYEASVQEAIETPWAKSFAMSCSACSDSAMSKRKMVILMAGAKMQKWEYHDEKT